MFCPNVVINFEAQRRQQGTQTRRARGGRREKGEGGRQSAKKQCAVPNSSTTKEMSAVVWPAWQPQDKQRKTEKERGREKGEGKGKWKRQCSLV